MNSLVVIDYLPLMVEAEEEDRKLKRDLAKTNYLNIHKKRSKRK